MPTADLFIEYSVSCQSGKAEQVIAALAPDFDKNGGFSTAVEARIARYISEFSFGEEHIGNDFLIHFFQLRNKARDALISRFASESGLSLRLTLELDGEAPLKDLRIVPLEAGPFHIRPANCTANLAVTLRGPLRLIEDYSLPAALQVVKAEEKLPKLQANLARDVTEYATEWVVQDRIAIEQFSLKNFASLRDGLKAYLDQRLLERHGRRFDHIDLEFAGLKKLPPESVTFRETLPVLIKDATKEEFVEHSVTMQLNNLASYQAMVSVDPSAYNPELWMKAKIAPLVKEALFGITYADLVLRLDGDKLRKLLVDKANELGYVIAQYAAAPDHPFARQWVAVRNHRPRIRHQRQPDQSGAFGGAFGAAS